MFWRVASGSVSSSVEAILSAGNFTLEQLLAQGDLVQVSSSATRLYAAPKLFREVGAM